MVHNVTILEESRVELGEDVRYRDAQGTTGTSMVDPTTSE